MDPNVDQAWHYTTGAGLLNILQRHRLWASSAAFMNDVDEVTTGKRALRDAVEARQPPLSEAQKRQLRILGVLNNGQPDKVFLLSASTDGDALTLWRSYGQGTEAEYSLEFDPSVPLSPVMQNMAESHPNPPPNWGEEADDITETGEPIPGANPDEPHTWGGDWGAVRYLRDDATWAAEELERIVFELPPSEDGVVRIPFFGDYITAIDPSVLSKNPGFEDEREVRMTWAVYPWWRFVLYRPSRFGLTPYIEVAAADQTEPSWLERSREFILPGRVGRLPLKRVRIGPTRSTPSAVRTLRQLLDSHGYGTTAIDTSAAPYR